MSFSPYSQNGGTILALAGDDFSIVASDTRLSEGYSIHTRDCPKTYKLTETSVLACTGCHCDVLALTKMLEARLKMYEHEHNTKMSTSAIASMLSTILYYKRFFPYYAYNIIGGLDENGKGCVYSYDPVGHYQKETFKAAGTGGTILQPLLDNQIGYKNQNISSKPSMSLEKAVRMVKDVFTSAAERDIYTGDAIDINIVTKDGVKKETFSLRRD